MGTVGRPTAPVPLMQASGYRCPVCLKDDLADIIDEDGGVPQVLACLNCGCRFTPDWF